MRNFGQCEHSGCSNTATKKFGGHYFCENCLKYFRRTKAKYFWKERICFTIGPGCSVYRDYLVKLKRG